MSRVSGDFPVQLATRLPGWSASGLLRCIVLLPVCPCVVSFSNFHEHDTQDLLRTSRLHPVASSSDTYDTPYFLVTC